MDWIWDHGGPVHSITQIDSIMKKSLQKIDIAKQLVYRRYFASLGTR
jgi:hypothetical protein